MMAGELGIEEAPREEGMGGAGEREACWGPVGRGVESSLEGLGRETASLGRGEAGTGASTGAAVDLTGESKIESSATGVSSAVTEPCLLILGARGMHLGGGTGMGTSNKGAEWTDGSVISTAAGVESSLVADAWEVAADKAIGEGEGACSLAASGLAGASSGFPKWILGEGLGGTAQEGSGTRGALEGATSSLEPKWIVGSSAGVVGVWGMEGGGGWATRGGATSSALPPA